MVDESARANGPNNFRVVEMSDIDDDQARGNI